MHIRTVDGTAQYAKWLLRARVSGDHPFNADQEGVFCFDYRERIAAEERLNKQGTTCQVEELPEPPGFAVTRGIKYASRSEVLAHIEQGIEPESMLIPRLREHLAETRERAANAEAWTAAALHRLREAEEKIGLLERATGRR